MSRTIGAIELSNEITKNLLLIKLGFIFLTIIIIAIIYYLTKISLIKLENKLKPYHIKKLLNPLFLTIVIVSLLMIILSFILQIPLPLIIIL